MEELIQHEDGVTVVEIRMFSAGGVSCELCGRLLEDGAEKHIRIGKREVVACPECAHRELLRKYRRLKRRTRELQAAFAEVKYHALFGNNREMKEKIIGLCEEYRDRFDADAEGNLIESGD